MSLADSVLAINNDLPIRTNQPVHSGKVRSVYWLTPEDSERLIKERGYKVAPDAPLAIMVISDRISAFDPSPLRLDSAESQARHDRGNLSSIHYWVHVACLHQGRA